MATITRAELMEHITALSGDTTDVVEVILTSRYIDVYRVTRDADGKIQPHGDSIATYSARIKVVD